MTKLEVSTCQSKYLDLKIQIWELFSELAAPLPTQLSANVPGKADCPSHWVPATQMGDPDEDSGSGFGLAQLWPLRPFGE